MHKVGGMVQCTLPACILLRYPDMDEVRLRSVDWRCCCSCNTGEEMGGEELRGDE